VLLSDSHRFVFVHIYKAGGSSIVSALGKYSIIDKPYHSTAAQIRSTLFPPGGSRVWSDYFKFTFARNPWAFCVSLFFWLQQNAQHDMCAFVRSLDFLSFLRLMQSPADCSHVFEHGSFWIYRRPLSSFVVDQDGGLLVDFVGRVEAMETDFAYVCEVLGIREPLPHTNRSTHAPWRDCYDREGRDIVAELFAPDIDRWGYRFE